jgi:DNA polymerase elongation subunit (family B)
MTSLKVLEFNMRMDNIEDLPFPPGSVLSHDQIDELRRYVKHDVKATADFLKASEPQLAFRRDLSKKYGRNFMNFNDVRIGKEIFIDALEKAGVRIRDDNGNLRQTPREQIVVKDILLPYLSFNHPELRRVHEEFKNLIIVNTKGDLKISADLDGFVLDYGTGGIHGSITDTLVTSDDEYCIRADDCASMYPNLAIKNRFYPEHLTEKFCDVYDQMFQERKKHKKGSVENAAYKLALNGSYGQSNSEFSPFYDPQFTMSITISGQLVMSMLVERLMAVPTVEMIFCNTDGVCYKVRRDMLPEVDKVCKEWENLTMLELETEYYNRIYIEHVNSYILSYEEQS